MLSDFMNKNSIEIGVVILLLTLLALSVHRFVGANPENRRHSLAGGIVVFLLWLCVVLISGGYISSMVADLKISYLTPHIVNICSVSIIILMFIRKSFLAIDFFEQKQIQKGHDVTDSRVISKILKIIFFTAILFMYGEHFGMSFSGLLAFGGVGGIAVGMASKDVLSNFVSGVMLYFDRPFKIGDWIRSPDRNIEGVVTEIGWRLTKITTFENCPMYIPNSVFSGISVENPERMSNRRIETTFGIRYQDVSKIQVIVSEIRKYLEQETTIDHQQTLLVYFNGFGNSSLNILVYCFTITTEWSEWLAIQQRVYLKIIEVVHENEACFALPSQTIYMSDTN